MSRIIMVPSGVDHYRAKAAECERKEKEARDPAVKQGFAKMARQWLELAEQDEK